MKRDNQSISDSPDDISKFLTEDPDAPSEAYQQLIAETDAWEWWENATPAQKLTAIVDTYPAQNWTDPDCLAVLAWHYDKPMAWLRIVTVGKSIGVDIRALERAVKEALTLYARWKLAPMVYSGSEQESPGQDGQGVRSLDASTAKACPAATVDAP